MQTVKVKDIYNVTQISKTNSEAWERLIKFMNGKTEEVLFDFEDIELTEPWNNEMFSKLIGNELVYIKVYSSEKIKTTIDLACSIGNIKSGRVINEDEILMNEPTTDRQLEALKNRFIQAINIKDGIAKLVLEDVIENVSEGKTIKALESAIEQINADQGVKFFELEINIFIQLNIVKILANTLTNLAEKGIEVEIDPTNMELSGKVSIYQCIEGTTKWGPAKRASIFKDTVEKNTVGMLTKYKETKKVDEFGRSGCGEISYCKVALFKGFKKVGRDIVLQFEIFNNKTFCTKLHYSLEYNGESLDELDKEDIEIRIQDIGLCNKFIGRLYHFNFPIQYGPADYINTYKENSDGSIEQVDVTLPEHIKMVLDDFDIKFNRKSLIYSINETENYLEALKNKQNKELDSLV